MAWTLFSLMEYAFGVDMDEKFFFGFFLQGSFGGKCQWKYNSFIAINLFYMGACDHGCVYVLL